MCTRILGLPFEKAWKQAEAQGGSWLGIASQKRREAGVGYSVIRARLVSSLLTRTCHLQHTVKLSHWHPWIIFSFWNFYCLEALADILLWKVVVNWHLLKNLLVAAENFGNEFDNCGHILRLLRNSIKLGLIIFSKVRSEFNMQRFPGVSLWQIKPKVGKTTRKTDKLAAD